MKDATFCFVFFLGFLKRNARILWVEEYLWKVGRLLNLNS